MFVTMNSLEENALEADGKDHLVLYDSRYSGDVLSTVSAGTGN